MLSHTRYISFELSNLCNNSRHHIRCPLHGKEVWKYPARRSTLPLALILRTLEELARFDFHGTVGYNIYNEPLIDPRLFLIIQKTHEILGPCSTYLLTNGCFLTQQLVSEAYEFGLDNLQISTYSDQEHEYCSTFTIPKGKAFLARRTTLIDLSDQFKGPYLDLHEPCHGPLGEICVCCTGHITLCCREWMRTGEYFFGNLNETPLHDILAQGKMEKTWERLSRGDRYLDICRRCETSRCFGEKK